jgi:hypothetical protein
MVVRTRADRDTNLDVLGTHYERLVADAGAGRRAVRSREAPALARVGDAG